VKFKLDENLPVSAASVLAAAGHDVDTVPGEHLADPTRTSLPRPPQPSAS
jgi:hypothetical protein